MAEERTVPDPVVDPQVYDEEYYRHRCLGADEWSASGGKEPHVFYDWILTQAGFRSGMTLVDVGCGRGELVALAARKGAVRSIGLDYSAAAIRLAEETVRVNEVTDRAEVHQVDVRSSPVPDGVADLVTLLDVVEHLSDDELHATLVECRRVLRPGGRVFAHTLPNRLVHDVTYPVLRIAARLRGERWPSDPRNDFEHEMHVNEQSLGSLRRALRRAGFSDVTAELGTAVYVAHLPERGVGPRLMRRLARTPGLRRFGVADLVGTGTVPG